MKHPHIVPQFYLDYFSNSDSKIFVFDKPTLKEFSSTPNKIAKINGFYDFDQETELSKKQRIEHKLGKIETDTAPTYKHLYEKLENNNFSGFSQIERDVLSKFVFVQILRTEGSRNTFNQLNIELFEQLKENVHESELNDALSKSERFDPKSMQLHMIDQDIEEKSKVLKDRIWTIHKNKTKHRFLTSDHPVCRHNHGNNQRTELEIFLPLSPKYILSIIIEDQHPTLKSWNDKVLDLNEKEVSTWYNNLTIFNAERQIYNSELHFVFAKKVLKEQPKFRYKNQLRVDKKLSLT